MLDKRGGIRIIVIFFITVILLVLVLQVQVISSSNEIRNFKPTGVSEKVVGFSRES